jgi:hypothetical protein
VTTGAEVAVEDGVGEGVGLVGAAVVVGVVVVAGFL